MVGRLSSPDRSASKVTSKLTALTAAGLNIDQAWAGPNGYIPHLGDTKICHLHIAARSLLGSRISVDVRLEVEDSPNAAAVVINAVRVARVARERGLRGAVDEPSAYLFKSPRITRNEPDARAAFESIISEKPTT
jgi:myo-inositol-1-phosphate synthase